MYAWCFMLGVRLTKDSCIVAGEGERVMLGGAMKARGGPEGWLTAVEALMRSALKAATKRAMKEYVVQPRTQWIRQQPAQLVLLVSSIFWCRQVSLLKLFLDTRCCQKVSYPRLSSCRSSDGNFE